MADKEIIIDGVDVSECSYHYKHTRVCLLKMDAAGRYYNCANWHDCDFKKLSQQLKRKEQALDEIERFCKDACDNCEKFTPNRQSDISCRLCQAAQILNIINKAKEK